MTEKEKLLDNLVEKSGKSKDEIDKLIADKVNELSGLVSEEGAIYIIANDLGVRLEGERPKADANFVKIEEVTEPKTPTSIICKVIRKYDRVTFSSSNGSEGAVQSALVGDETGVTRVVFWGEKTEILDNVHEGDILKITNAYSRENGNTERIEVHYGQYSDIEVNPEGEKVEVKEFKGTDIDFKEKSVEDMAEGDRNIKLTGMVTDFDIPRFYLACPECFKKVLQDEGTHKCAEHEEVEAIRVPIVNMVVDDGSGSVAVVSFRDRAESMTGLNSEEIIALTEDIDKYRGFSKKMVGSKVELGGNVGTNNMTGDKQVMVNQVLGVELKDVEEVVKEEIEEIKEEAKKEPKKEEVKEEKAEKKEEPKKEEKKPEKKKEVVDDDDDLDLDIEEIDIDDDLL